MRNIILFSVISLVFFGCSGVANKITESIDTDIASASVNKKYADEIQEKVMFSSKYGELLLEKELKNGEILYVHTSMMESSGFSIGIFRSVDSHIWRTWGFKVKDGIIIDWAYGIYNPEGSGKKELFFVSFGFVIRSLSKFIKRPFLLDFVIKCRILRFCPKYENVQFLAKNGHF